MPRGPSSDRVATHTPSWLLMSSWEIIRPTGRQKSRYRNHPFPGEYRRYRILASTRARDIEYCGRKASESIVTIMRRGPCLIWSASTKYAAISAGRRRRPIAAATPTANIISCEILHRDWRRTDGEAPFNISPRIQTRRIRRRALDLLLELEQFLSSFATLISDTYLGTCIDSHDYHHVRQSMTETSIMLNCIVGVKHTILS